MLACLSTSMTPLHGKVVCTCIYQQSMNRIFLKKAGLDVTQSHPVQDTFQPMPGLISGTVGTRKLGLLPHERKAVKWLTLANVSSIIWLSAVIKAVSRLTSVTVTLKAVYVM